MTPDTFVTRKACVGTIMLVGALMTASSAQAQVQVYTETINGAACALERMAVIVGIVLMAACGGPTSDRPPATNSDTPAPPVIQRPQTPEEHREAISKARAEEAEHAKKLAAAVQAETRNDSWASKKEQELRASYASSGNPRGVLKSVDCRSTKCDLLLEVPARDMPDSPAGSIASVNQWIAASQPCGYTIVAGGALTLGPGAVRIVIDCSQPSPKSD